MYFGIIYSGTWKSCNFNCLVMSPLDVIYFSSVSFFFFSSYLINCYVSFVNSLENFQWMTYFFFLFLIMLHYHFSNIDFLFCIYVMYLKNSIKPLKNEIIQVIILIWLDNIQDLWGKITLFYKWYYSFVLICFLQYLLCIKYFYSIRNMQWKSCCSISVVLKFNIYYCK